MKKHLAILTVAVLVMLAGCGSGAEAPDQTTKASSSVNAISADEIDTSVSNADQDASYDESSATKISLSGSSASISGDGASEKDGTITIQQEGTYVVTGTLNGGHAQGTHRTQGRVHLLRRPRSLVYKASG